MKRVLLCVFLASLIASESGAALFLDDDPGQDCSAGTYRIAERDCGGSSTGHSSYDTLDEFVTNLTAQSTNYIRAGSYFESRTTWGAGSLNVSTNGGASGNPTIITTIAGEERQAIIYTDSGKDHYPPDTDSGGSCDSVAPLVSNNNANCYYTHPAVNVSAAYVTLKGLKIYGMVRVVSTNNVIVEECDIGGGGPFNHWGHAIYTNDSSDVTYRNNTIHDNPKSGEQNTHKAAVQSYDSAEIIYEYNTLYNIAEYGIAVGDAGQVTPGSGEITARYNFFNTISLAWMGIAQDNDIEFLTIHNNIFLACISAIQIKQSPDYGTTRVYNNTFINSSSGGDIIDAGSNFSFTASNNLHFHTSGSGDYYSTGVTTPANITADYNVYYASGTSPAWVWSGGSTTSLATWAAVSGIAEDNSLSHNPNFVDASGTDPEDFKRSGYTESFGGSSYGVHAGAYETGSEQIGHDWSGAADTTDPTVTAFTIPSTATSLTVSISTFTATDDTGVTGYCVNESASAPTAGSCSGSGWAGSAQTDFTFATDGAKTLYAWAKDAAGNISTSLNDSVTITLPAETSRHYGFTGAGVKSN